MTQHTPGPWQVITRSRTSKPDRFGRTTETRETYVYGANGLSIAKLYIGHDQDARLIAAAPELLASLQDMVHYEDLSPAEQQPAVELARTAIAKATGDK